MKQNDKTSLVTENDPKALGEKEPKRLVNPFSDEYKSSLPTRTPEEEKERGKFMELLTHYRKTLLNDELITHHALSYSVDSDHEGLVIEFCKQLIQEYGCKSPSEIALAEIAASAFVRHLNYLYKLRCLLYNLPFNNLMNNSVSIISKETDRSQRIFISAITTLKHFKNSPLTVNVKATAAFFAQNQQVNTTNEKLAKGEINEPK